MARSRRPLVVEMSGAFRSAWACLMVSQFPTRTPLEATPFTRAMPAASSGARRELFDASTASFRTAVSRTLIETVPSRRPSSATRHAMTVALVKPVAGRSAQAKNSSRPGLYTLLVMGEETVSSNEPFQPGPVEAATGGGGVPDCPKCRAQRRAGARTIWLATL